MYLAFNDKIVNEEKFPASFWERLNTLPPFFYYKIFVSNSIVPLWNIHKKYFELVALQLELDLPDFFIDYHAIIRRVVNRNKFFNGAVVKIVFYPWQNSLEFVAIPQKVDYNYFVSNTNDIIILSSSKIIQPHTPNFIWYADLHSFINKENHLAVSNKKVLNSRYNILAKKGDIIVSPTYKTDAPYNALQIKILSLLEQQGLTVYDDKPIDIGFMHEADELWLISNYYGIYNRIGFDEHRYFQSNLSETIIEKLNRLIFS